MINPIIIIIIIIEGPMVCTTIVLGIMTGKVSRYKYIQIKNKYNYEYKYKYIQTNKHKNLFTIIRPCMSPSSFFVFNIIMRIINSDNF